MSADVVRFADSHGFTARETLLTALAALLSRYTGEEDLVIGARSEAGPSAELRLDLSDNPTFRALQERVRQVLRGSLPAGSEQDSPEWATVMV